MIWFVRFCLSSVSTILSGTNPQYPILETAITGRLGLASSDKKSREGESDMKKGSLLELSSSEFVALFFVNSVPEIESCIQ